MSVSTAQAQEAAVPRVIQFNGVLRDSAGQALAGVQGVQFALYAEQEGGAPLWIESQNVTADDYGRFAVLLGAATSDGLPVELFASGESRWLGVTAQAPGEPEQPRVLLVSVPYALKAADAETIGGLPPSAFVLASGIVTERVQASGGLDGLTLAAVTDQPLTAGAVGDTNHLVKSIDDMGGTARSDLIDDGGGKLGWDDGGGTADVTLGRVVPNRLDLGTGDSLLWRNAAGDIGVLTAGANAVFFDTRNDKPGDWAFRAFITGEINNRFQISSGGVLRWGSGAAALDTNLYRGGADQLKTDDSLVVLGDVTATKFIGDGSMLTTLNANNVTSGVLGVARGGTGAAPGAGDQALISDSTSAATWRTIPDCNTNNMLTYTASTNSFGCDADDSGGGGSGTVTSLSEGTGIDLTPDTITAAGTVAIDTTTVPQKNVSNTFTEGQAVSTGTGVAVPDGFGGTAAIDATHTATADLHYGVFGQSDSTLGTGVFGWATATTGDAWGVLGQSDSTAGVAVYGLATGGIGSYGVYSEGDAFVLGDLEVDGTVTKSGGSFKIDHPLDPANKYLYHSFVESPDMMNLYNGIAQLNGQGEASVQLPDWFEALNQDFRYQLTAIGAPGPNLYIAEEIRGNSFRIAGGSPGAKVSWQVTGIRHDPFAETHRIQVEVDKAPDDQGLYLHPEEYGQPREQGIRRAHRPRRGPRGTAP